MNNIVELLIDEIEFVDGAGSGTTAYEDGKNLGNKIGEAVEETAEAVVGFFVCVYDAFTNGR